MELGQCPKCATPYGPADVVAYGILRSRREADGGPYMEYACTSCGRRIRLVPHGQGRYAPPGQPPPRAVPEDQRRPHWASGAVDDAAKSAAPPTTDAPAPDDSASTWEEPEPVAIPDFGGGLAEAREILGVTPQASQSEIEQAFRARSKTCHPDKVAHLDREFQELANAKFQRLHAAYQRLAK